MPATYQQSGSRTRIRIRNNILIRIENISGSDDDATVTRELGGAWYVEPLLRCRAKQLVSQIVLAGGGESLCQLFLILNFFCAFGLFVPPKGEIKKNDVLERKVFSFSIVESIYIGLST